MLIYALYDYPLAKRDTKYSTFPVQTEVVLHNSTL